MTRRAVKFSGKQESGRKQRVGSGMGTLSADIAASLLAQSSDFTLSGNAPFATSSKRMLT